MMIMASSVLRSLRLALVVILEQKLWCVQGIFKEREVGRPVNENLQNKRTSLVVVQKARFLYIKFTYILFKQYTLPVKNRQEGSKKLVLLKRLAKKTNNVINIIANNKTDGWTMNIKKRMMTFEKGKYLLMWFPSNFIDLKKQMCSQRRFKSPQCLVCNKSSLTLSQKQWVQYPIDEYKLTYHHRRG